MDNPSLWFARGYDPSLWQGKTRAILHKTSTTSPNDLGHPQYMLSISIMTWSDSEMAYNFNIKHFHLCVGSLALHISKKNCIYVLL